ncbi:MAG TPA: hypothetical protein VIX86_11085 [Streptosporangiaceae bacterium]
MAEAPDDRPAAGADPVILRESRVFPSVLYGGLLVVFILALVRGLGGASTTGGAVAVAVVCGALAVLAASAWVMVLRRRGHLEITGQAITYAGYVRGKAQTVVFSRQQGGVLRVVEMGAPRFPRRCLAADGTSAVIPVNLFRLSEIRQGCAATGWQFRQGQGPKGSS